MGEEAPLLGLMDPYEASNAEYGSIRPSNGAEEPITGQGWGRWGGPRRRGQLLVLLRLGVSASIIIYIIVFLLMSASFDAIQSWKQSCFGGETACDILSALFDGAISVFLQWCLYFVSKTASSKALLYWFNHVAYCYSVAKQSRLAKCHYVRS